MKRYGGIGSRAIDFATENLIESCGHWLAHEGWTLVSGGAEGSDSAFYRGAGGVAEVWRPEHAKKSIAFDMAEHYHPNWGACSPYVRKLHARNVMIVLGETCDVPVSFVVCWTPKGKCVGGTAMGIKVANDHGIPVYNLGVEGTSFKGLQAFVSALQTV